MSSKHIQDFHILILEDNDLLRDLMVELSSSLGVHTLVAVGTLAEAWDALEDWTPDILIADWLLKPNDATAKDIIHHCSQNDVDILIVSGHRDEAFLNVIRDLGAHTMLKKPFGTSEFIYTVIKICSKSCDDARLVLDELDQLIDKDRIVQLSKDGI